MSDARTEASEVPRFLEKNLRRIAVLTSGGDAPGMNAAIRAVVRCGIAQGWEVYGVRRGYAGLLEGRFEPLDARTVSGIVHRGGTCLGTARCPEFQTAAGIDQALARLRQGDVDALIVIGGNGSQAGALALSRAGFPVVGVASTIDNDLGGSDLSIGVDTALNIALEAIDRLKTTASSYDRLFLVEVMGRQCGYLALTAGLAGGAEVVVIPEVETSPEEMERLLSAAYQSGKRFGLVVVAEGARHNAQALSAYLRQARDRIGFELRVTILGHVQRGGAPTAQDRLLATRLGAGAVAALAEGAHGVLVGIRNAAVTRTPLDQVVGAPSTLPGDLLALAPVLAM